MKGGPGDAQLQQAWQQVLAENPRIAEWGMQVGYGPQSRNHGGGYLEYYHPQESLSPRPGVPYLEVFDRSLQGEQLKNMLFGDALHHAPVADPDFRGMRDMFEQVLSPEQRALSQKRYADYSTPGSPHYNAESRPYPQWFGVSDLDAIIRGYVAGQWPKDMYSGDERLVLDSMQRHLKSKK